MIFNLTNVFFRNHDALYGGKKRIAINEGGTSSSKTFSVLQLLIDLARNRTKQILISVVSESIPHLKRGCVRDFKLIMDDQYDPSRWNATDRIYKFPNAEMEFFSADDSAKLRGGRRDLLFVNEANNIPYNSFTELYIRTRRFAILDHNPVSEYWAHTELKKLAEVEWIHSTYLDAKEVLPIETVNKIESYKDRDPNWWNVYGLGLVGNVQGLVHPAFLQVDKLPEGKDPFYGLDFGFSNDPTVLTANVIDGEDLYSDQSIYMTGLTNDQISNRLESLGLRRNYDEIFADAAEPKSIEEIRRRGWNIKSAPKGPDSIRTGIQKINQYRQHWTKRSVDAIKEMRNYRYIETQDGKLTEKPIDDFNHAMDSRRYAVVSKTMGPEAPRLFWA